MGDRDFDGRTALVTGSATGFGRVLSLIFAQGGANVVINARTSKDLMDSTVSAIREEGGSAIGVLADVSKPDAVDLLAQKAIEAFGKVDILVNSASVRPLGRLLELDYEAWREVVGVKLDGAFLCCRAFLPGMIAQGFGRVINISGLDAFWGTAQKIHVGTANFGLIGFSRGLAVEYADQGITVNTVVPGVFGSAVPHEGDGSAGRNLEELAKRLPAGRMGRPEEIAAVCRFLAQEDASFVTGQTIHVNGGAYPTRGSA